MKITLKQLEQKGIITKKEKKDLETTYNAAQQTTNDTFIFWTKAYMALMSAIMIIMLILLLITFRLAIAS